MIPTRARSAILSSLVAVLCAAVLLTSLGNGGLLRSARGELVAAAPVDQPIGDTAVELLHSREFAGFIGSRAYTTPFAVHAIESGNLATARWSWDGTPCRRSAASSGQKLHSLYCVWIV